MSLFSNDMRVATTATPSFAQEANVGQFGWTGADAAHYNQLIQYVDECRKIWINLEEKITYVEKILEDVTNIDDQVKYIELMTNEVKKWRQEVLTSRDLVQSMYTQVLPLYQDFTVKYPKVVAMHADVEVMHEQVHDANQEAHESAEKAEIARDEARDIAEELRKGQVYRGTWNIEANTGYPAPPDTNSVWDVVLNEGSLEYKFDNTTWFWGDRLLYLKDDNKFSQIESGSTVISVNGKGGAVTLTAADVHAHPDTWMPTAAEVGARPDTWIPTAAQTGALPITGGTLTGQTIINHDAGLQVRSGDYGIRMINSGSTLYHQAGKMDRDAADQKLAMTGWYGTPLSFFRVAMAEGKYAYIQQGGTDFRIYHQGYKPTANDVGAVAATNGVLGQALKVGNTPNNIQNLEGTNMIRSGGAGSHATVVGNTSGPVYLDTSSIVYVRTTGGTESRVYHESFKPTAGDLGVVPTTDVTTAGEFGKIPKMNSGGLIEIGNAIDFHLESAKNDYDSRLSVTKNPDGTNYTLNVLGSDLNVGKKIYENGVRVYSEGYRPSAADISAVSLSGNSRIQGSLELTDSLSVEGRATFQKTPGGIWISTVSGEVGQDKVVSGSLSGGASIGAHSNALDNWKPFYINTYAASKDNYPNAPVVMGYPTRQLSIQDDSGVSTPIQYPVVSKGKRAGSPNWWLSQSVLRFMDGIDLMLAATNGLRTTPDWAYMSRFKYHVRITVHAPNVSVWSHKYGFDIYNYQTTNAAGQSYLVPHQFDCHAGSGAQAVISKQLVPSSENGGMPYFELHFPTGTNVSGDPQLEVQLEVIAVNVFE